MPRRYFSKTYTSPYFKTHYGETEGGQYEQRMNDKIDRLRAVLLNFWRGKKK
jgi:hypothetical protein